MNSNKIRVALYMNNMSVPDKLIKAKNVLDNILANPSVFTSPGNLLTRMSAAIAELETALINAQDGGRNLTAMKHQRENEFDAAMLRLAHYIELTADGDPGTIILAGLDVRPNGGSRAISAFEVSRGKDSGTALLKAVKVKGASYLWQYSTDNDNWIDAGAGTRSRKEVKGLSAGTRYWFRYACIDSKGQHPWALPVSLIVV